MTQWVLTYLKLLKQQYIHYSNRINHQNPTPFPPPRTSTPTTPTPSLSSANVNNRKEKLINEQLTDFHQTLIFIECELCQIWWTICGPDRRAIKLFTTVPHPRRLHSPKLVAVGHETWPLTNLISQIPEYTTSIYLTKIHSEQKCAHLCSEWMIVGHEQMHSDICKIGLLAGISLLIGWFKVGECLSCNEFWAHLTCGNFHHFSKVTDIPLVQL